MTRCIEYLEARQLLSVTPATLKYDLKAINVDASADRVALNAIEQRSSADLNAIKSDLKHASSSTQVLLKAVEQAEGQYLAKLDFDVNNLLRATGPAQQGVSDGTQLIKRSTPRRIADVQADIAVLNSSTSGPLSAIRVDQQSTAVSEALTALLAANNSNARLTADAGKLNSDNAIIGATIVADSQTFSFSISDLSKDLQTLVA